MKQSELDKYEYIKCTKGLGYGGSNHAKNHYPILRKLFKGLPAYTGVLDIGCGTGKFPLWLKQEFPKLHVVGVDPVFVEDGSFTDGVSFFKGDTTNIPLIVDVITAFDVLEHLHPDDLISSLTRIDECTSVLFIAKICTRESHYKIEGREDTPLHMIVKPLEWWQDMFKEHTTFKSIVIDDGLLICYK